MNMVIGYILIILGTAGTAFSGVYIANDRRYTYAPPLTPHETTMLMLLFLGVLLLIGGIVVILFSILKSRNSAQLNQIQNLEKGHPKNVCQKALMNVLQEIQRSL